MNLKKIMLSERRQILKIYTIRFQFYEPLEKRNLIYSEKKANQ